MKVMMLIPWFYPSVGGAETGALELARKLTERGHSVMVLTPRYKRGWPREEVFQNIRIVRIPTLSLPGPRILVETLHSLAPFFSVGGWIRRFQPDMIHLHYFMFTGYAGWYWARRWKIPAALTLVGMDVYDPLHQPCGFLEPFNRAVVRGVSSLVAASEFIRDKLVKRFSISREHVQVIPYGVDESLFSPVEPRGNFARKALGISGEAFLILSVQRLHSRKGLSTLLEAFQKVHLQTPEAHLLLVGEGPEKPALSRRAKVLRLDGRVLFAGKVEESLLRQLYREADIFALHSLHEGFGIVLLEAMASGCPVVATSAGSIPEIVLHQETGLIAPAGNPHALGEAMLTLIRNPEMRKGLARAARERIQTHYSWRNVCDRYLALYGEAQAKER